MGFEYSWWVTPSRFALIFPETLPGMALFGLYTLVSLWLLYRRRADFRALRSSQVGLFIVGLLSIGLSSGIAMLAASPKNIIQAVPITQLTYPPTISLIALGILSAIAIWFGSGPGLVAGLVLGVAQARFSLLSANDIFAYAAWGLCTGLLVHQPYVGTFFKFIRTPLVAIGTGAFALVAFLGLNRLVETIPPFGVSAFEQMLGPFNLGWRLWLVCGIGFGILFTLIWGLAPHLRPHTHADVIPLTRRSLRARFIVALIPLIVCSFVLSVLMVTNSAMQLALDQAMNELDRSATIAGEGMEHFGVSGDNLLEKFSTDPTLLDPELRQTTLETDRQLVPFFRELLLTDVAGQVIAIAPQDTTDSNLSPEEMLLVNKALQFEMSGEVQLIKLPSGAVRMAFIRPLLDEENGQATGVLLGRVQPEINPEIQRVLTALQAAHGVGEGFIVDDRGLIVLHPEPDVVGRPWRMNPNALTWEVGSGLAYRDLSSANNESTLFYIRHIAGTPFTVVIQLPYSVVFEMSRSIFSPLLLSQLPFGLILLSIVPFLVARITRPLHMLAAATEQIAEGNLEIPVHISGDDEVAQLGSAFEQMRLRLKDRLNDLSLLLNISRSVSATLTLNEGVPLILEGVLEETGATVARFILLENDERADVFSSGLSDPAFQGLDRALVSIVSRRRDPFIEQDLRGNTTPGNTVPGTATPDIVRSPLRSIAAFPVRLQNRVVAILWVGALKTQAFDEAKVHFLNTLASQAAVLVENIRLFEATEDGRQRLAAILASTTDAILVIDHDRRLLLINPAAQTLLNLNEMAYGRSISSLDLPEPMLEAVTVLGEDTTHMPPTVEFSLPDKRTFNTNIAPIKGLATAKTRPGTETQVAGWVAVMRDVTHFKELDEMKTDFVSTVSHDLRAPLTFMRGYVTMLNMVGELNDKQQEYQERILEGIEQMSALIDDLLNLRRIEAGLGIRQEPCRLGLVLLEAVDLMRARAATKGVTLRLEPARPIPTEALADKSQHQSKEVMQRNAERGANATLAQRASATVIGDRTLLRQAIGNLVDNAIKYTPAGGLVSVGMDLSENVAVVRISDTGIGITPENQVRLFEKFYRIKRRETTDIAGTGLGLALVKSIVERHQGRVWMESELNKGSTFYIALPLQTTASGEEHIA
ncbi:MAG: ATP-binding protein [Anaerolineae bacterium]|jgi:signal transduction histidine kinase|nr:ATP-binding protein [Anaerolineae bacterium]